MRRRRSSTAHARRRGRVLACAVVAALLPIRGRLDAQSAAGAQFLLIPIAARLVGLGGAGVAERLGGESAISNPAALGYAGRSEGALLYGQDVRGERALGVAVLPSRRFGTFSVGGFWFNLGDQAVTGRGSADTVGSVLIRNVGLQASYASAVGRRLGVGVTFRVSQLRFDCSGLCNPTGDPDPVAESLPTTSMVDVGAQYDLRGIAPVRLGLAVRNLGLRLQVRDREQADPLPTQLAFGARYEVPGIAARVRDLQLRVLGEVVTGLGAGGTDPSAHLGVDATYRRAFSARAGWAQQRGEDAGPSIGFGYAAGRFGVDVARQLTGLSVDSGEPPTYVGLRYHF